MKNQSGQTIIEILVAIVIIAILLLGLLTLTTNSVKNSSYSESLNLATKYSTQATDWIKAEKASVGWGALLAKIASGGTYCLPTIPTIDTLSDSAGTCDPDGERIDNIFWRELHIEVDNVANPTSITLTATTTWEGTNTHFAIIEAEVTKW